MIKTPQAVLASQNPPSVPDSWGDSKVEESSSCVNSEEVSGARKLSRHNHVLAVPFVLEASGDNSTKMEDTTNYIMHLPGQSSDTPAMITEILNPKLNWWPPGYENRDWKNALIAFDSNIRESSSYVNSEYVRHISSVETENDLITMESTVTGQSSLTENAWEMITDLKTATLQLSLLDAVMQIFSLESLVKDMKFLVIQLQPGLAWPGIAIQPTVRMPVVDAATAETNSQISSTESSTVVEASSQLKAARRLKI